MKKIDIIIPLYKAIQTLPKTLGSICAQTISEQTKVTMVCDADGLHEEYLKIKEKFSHFIDVDLIIMEENGGPGIARQKGLDSTNLPFVTFIDADDTFANAFSLALLLSNLEPQTLFHTAIGVFIEEHPGFKFIQHNQDMVWMFGKLYRRDFLKKYNIGFNPEASRSNEDNGFNTIVRLVSSEQERILFLDNPVYIWHFKEDSITRVNNYEYSYNQSFPGYTDNMIYAIKKARHHKPFNNYIDIWAIQVMAQLYYYYLQTCARDPRFKKQNYNYCKKYYNEIFDDILKRVSIENCKPIFGEVLAQQSPGNRDVIPEVTIYDFIQRLSIQEDYREF